MSDPGLTSATRDRPEKAKTGPAHNNDRDDIRVRAPLKTGRSDVPAARKTSTRVEDRPVADSSEHATAQTPDLDRRWAALQAGLADMSGPDFDASLFDDGPGPWIVLKGSQSDGPDPDDVFTVPASLERVVHGLDVVQAVHATAEDWINTDRSVHPQPPELRILAYFSETNSIYETMRMEKPVLDQSLPAGTPTEHLAACLLQIISDRLESRDAIAIAP